MRLRSQTPKTAKLAAPALLGHNLLFLFNNYALDTDRRELRSRGALINVEPQVFDLLTYLIEQREHVVSKDDLIASVWKGRIVSDSTLDSRVNAARKAVGDSGEKQDTIRTIARKGLRFVASVRRVEEQPEVGSTRPVIAEKQTDFVLPQQGQCQPGARIGWDRRAADQDCELAHSPRI